MAGIPERPDAFFRLSPAEVGKAQCFAVRRGEVESRAIGAALYAPELRLFIEGLAKNPSTSGFLRDYVDINPRIDANELEPDSSVSFIPMDAVEDGATGGVSPSSRMLAEVRKGYTPFAEGDILWAKITPCMENGKSCIASGLVNGIGFGSTEFHVLRSRDPRLSQAFLWEFLNQETLRKVARYAFTGSAGHQRVPDTFLADLPFPLLASSDQERLVSQMAAARAERRAKQAEADALLAGLDSYLLATLGLTPPPKDERKVFAIRLCNLGKRVDPYSNQSRFRKLFEHILASKYRVATFKEIATRIFSGVTPLAKGDAYVPPPEGVRFIRSGEITADGEVTPTSDVHLSEAIHNGMMKRSQLESGDLLIAIVGATIGATGVFNRDEPANINQAIAAVRLAGDEISPEFACLYLHSSIGQALLDYFKRPVARANINLEEIGDIPLVIPPKDVQEKIVIESHRRREDARRLCAEADAGWQAAKYWFEEQLLGPVQS